MQKKNCRWKPDETSAECQQCAQAFDFFSRRHHCRCCGGLFCGCCSGSFIPRELLHKVCQVKEIKPHHPHVDNNPEEKEKEKETQSGGNPSLFAGLINTFMGRLSALQRVCLKCHWKARRLLEAFTEPSSSAADPTRTHPSYPIKCTLPGSGRERKIYVISLRGKSLFDKRDYVGLSAVFEELERLIGEGTGVPNATDECHDGRSHSATLNPSPSNDSISTLYSSDQSTFEATLCFDEAGAHRWKRRRGIMNLEESPRKSYHRVTLQVPVLIPECKGGDTLAGTVSNVRVRTRLVGLTQQQSFNREVLQQETIGTDAYVILPDEELGPVPRYSDITPESSFVLDPFGTPATGNGSVVSEPSYFATNSTLNPSGVVSRLNRGIDWSAHGTSMDGIRYVWETIEQFGGATPICAVIDYTPCDKETSTPGSPVTADTSKCRSDGAYTFGSGPIYVHCHKSEEQRYPSVREQASALHRALLLVVGKVIVRDWLQQNV
ncbi:zinc finger protein [Trypanosoma brucei equiperdum]|uniref:Zinc finger protein n=1 Tax=Trypanosoma brucei equiperdum TaxID=630700 RepID=A0A3L6L7W6_9TRYP|nr:zinc finger protein [Trypanosoma brucei equiperdum]